MGTYLAKQICISINRSMTDVYEFTSNPENLPKWAAGLSQSSIYYSEDHWIADSPMGQVAIRFAPENKFGILDHDVTLPSGEVNHNPFRVVPNNIGSELIFTLFKLPQMTEAEFDHDAAMVVKDLSKLKSILEN